VSRILETFEADCIGWYQYGDRRGSCRDAREQVYRALVSRHGTRAVMRHREAIRTVLDRAELLYARGRARDILRASLGHDDPEHMPITRLPKAQEISWGESTPLVP